jgi:CRISPR-associated protein Cas8a1/Csx13
VAALRVLVAEQAEGLLADARAQACRVVAFGSVPWASQQKTRIDAFSVQAGTGVGLTPFRAADQLFRARLMRPQRGEPWWIVPQTPELVARNVALGNPWWLGFSDFLGTLESDVRRWLFVREKGGLRTMVMSEEIFPDGPERAFVLACHEAWRRRLGALSERARDQHLDFFDLSRKEFDRLRIAFSRCKSAALFRQTVTDFWARAGSLAPLREQWPAILPFLDERRWRAGRDLALLALASYQGVGVDDVQDPPLVEEPTSS